MTRNSPRPLPLALLIPPSASPRSYEARTESNSDEDQLWDWEVFTPHGMFHGATGVQRVHVRAQNPWPEQSAWQPGVQISEPRFAMDVRAAKPEMKRSPTNRFPPRFSTRLGNVNRPATKNITPRYRMNWT